MLNKTLKQFDELQKNRTVPMSRKEAHQFLTQSYINFCEDNIKRLEGKLKETETLRAYDQHGNGYIGGQTNSEHNKAIRSEIEHYKQEIINAEIFEEITGINVEKTDLSDEELIAELERIGKIKSGKIIN